MVIHGNQEGRPGPLAPTAAWGGASEFDILLADQRRAQMEAALACDMTPTARELLPLLLSLSRLTAQLHAREMFE